MRNIKKQTAQNIVLIFKNNVLLYMCGMGRHGCQSHDFLTAT